MALDDVNCAVSAGERVALVGPSGAGKSTLLMHLNGLLPAPSLTVDDEAQVFIHSLAVTKPRLREIRKAIGFLFQDPDDQLFCPSVREDVAFGPLNLGLTQPEVDSRVDRCLLAVGLPEHGPRNPSQLSTGERKRVCLAGVLACEPSILVLDEPTNGLDPVGIAEIRNLIKSLTDRGVTVIMASHLLDEVEKVCTHVAILKKGNLLTAGAVDEVFVNEDIVEISATNNDQLKTLLIGYTGVTNIKEDGKSVQAFFPAGTANLEEVNRFCFENGVTLNLLTMKRKSLETNFFELTNN